MTVKLCIKFSSTRVWILGFNLCGSISKIESEKVGQLHDPVVFPMKALSFLGCFYMIGISPMCLTFQKQDKICTFIRRGLPFQKKSNLWLSFHSRQTLNTTFYGTFVCFVEVKLSILFVKGQFRTCLMDVVHSSDKSTKKSRSLEAFWLQRHGFSKRLWLIVLPSNRKFSLYTSLFISILIHFIIESSWNPYFKVL